MATYTIVDEDKDPLGPNEINAGEVITVVDGDVYIIDGTANARITFEYSGAGVPDIEIQMNETIPGDFTIQINSSMSVDMTIADNVDANSVDLDASDATALSLEIGHNASLGNFEGATSGPSTVLIGDNFTTNDTWIFGTEDDVLIVGDNGTFHDINMDAGGDTLTFGDFATVRNVYLGDGDDTLTFGDGMDGSDIDGDAGNDTFTIGADAKSGVVFDGGNDTDTINTQSPSATQEDFETTNVVCFGKGTLFEGADGMVAVEDIVIGQQVMTVDRGLQSVRWIGCTRVDCMEQIANPKLRPIRIMAGALGPGLPDRDLFVSQHHRILIRSAIAERIFGHTEVFVAAKKLTALDGVDPVVRPVGFEYFHLLMDQHEIVLSNGTATESLFLGEQAQIMMGKAARDELANLFRKGASITHSATARPNVTNTRIVARMIDRHQRNRKPLLNLSAPRPPASTGATMIGLGRSGSDPMQPAPLAKTRETSVL